MRTSTKRALAPLAVAGALVLTGLPPATADHYPPFELPENTACTFPLGVSATGGKLHTKTWYDEKGDPVRSITAGRGDVVTYTNLDTGAFLSLKTGGNVERKTYHPDGSQTVTMTGQGGLIFFPSDEPPGPSTTHYFGRVVYTIGTDGVWTLVSTSGRERDICAELA
ncbi:hypothetical protein [uncultured Kocuria sp.]|uniref:hypothetical protein n=1 Tax=uncultured Kocuria sp. TaxID=259305 RepID=UPI00262A376E|nr:hypothetical protein [uncultured Kocuria sp.]